MPQHLARLFLLTILAVLISILAGMRMDGYIRKFSEDPRKLCREEVAYPLYLVNWTEAHDFKMRSWADSMFAGTEITPRTNPIYFNARNGVKVFRQTVGVSLMDAAPFLAGHFWAKRYGYEANGFSLPYVRVLYFWNILLLLTGLYWLYLLARQFVSPAASVIALATLIGSTQLPDLLYVFDHYQSVHLFFLHAGLLYFCHRFFYHPGYISGLCLGVIMGLIMTVRPVEFLLLPLPFLWMTGLRWSHIRVKLYHLIRNHWHYLVALLAFLIPVYIQLSYWWNSTNKAFVFNDQVLGIDTSFSKLIDVMVSADKGWIVYSPMLGLMFLGLFFMRGKASRVSIALIYAFVAILYGVSFLVFWWNNGDNQHDFFLQSFVFLFLPFCMLVEFSLKKWLTGLSLALVILVFSAVNLWRLSDHFSPRSLWNTDNKNIDYLMATFLQDTVAEQKLKYLDVHLSLDENIAMDSIWLKRNREVCLNATDQYIRRFDAKINNGEAYFRFSVMARSEMPETDSWKYAQMIISFYRGGKNISNEVLRVPRYLEAGKWKRVWIDAKVPQGADRLAISIWNGDSKSELCFKEMSLASFSETLPGKN